MRPSRRSPNRTDDEGISEEGYAREVFVKNTYSVLLLETAITAVVMLYWYMNREAIVSVQEHMVFWTVLTLVLLLILTSFHRLTPVNYLLMIFFCISQGMILSAMTAYYGTNTFLSAVFTTATIFACLTAHSFSYNEVLMEGRALTTLLLILIALVAVNFIVGSDLLDVAAAVTAAVLFSVYILNDTTKMILRLYNIQVRPDDYIYHATALYVDVTCLFAIVLQLGGYFSFFIGQNTFRIVERTKVLPIKK